MAEMVTRGMSVQGIGINKGDEYYTPKYVVDYFDKFDYDPATTPEKAEEFGISNFDTIDTDGLSKDWSKFKRVWLNPPFTLKKEFIEKAKRTYLNNGCEIYVLLPISYLTTRQFHNLHICGTLYIPNMRIAFEFGKEGVKKSPSMGSVILKIGEVNKIQYIEF